MSEFFHFHANFDNNYDTLSKIFIFVFAYTHEDQADEDIFWNKFLKFLQSSLLMSILHELPQTEGSVKVRGKISYTSQQPWVFSASLRQNIVFGNKFDNARYSKIIKACALDKVYHHILVLYRYIKSEKHSSIYFMENI